MSNITFQIGIVNTISEDLILNVYEAQAPEAIVYTETLIAPHPAIATIIATGFDTVTHIIKLIGATSNLEYNNYELNPETTTVLFYTPIKFKIGDGQALTPVAGTSNYINPALIGLVADVDFIYNRNGLNQRLGDHYNFNPVTGEIVLNVDDIWNADPADQVWITRQPKSVNQQVNDSVVGKLFGGFVDAPGAVSYIASHLRKLIRLAPGSAYTFLLATPVPIGYNHSFTQMGGAGNATIYFLNAPLIWLGSTVTSIILGQKDTASFSFDGTNWNCSSFSDNSNSLPAYARIAYVGSSILGNVVVDSYFSVGIPLQPDTNYWAIGTMRGLSGDSNYDNDISWVTTAKTVNGFTVSVREYNNALQNLIFDFIIVRIN